MSSQVPGGDLTSPTTFMNNTHMKLEPGLSAGLETHQQHFGAESMNLELGLTDQNEFQQQQQYGMAVPQTGAGDGSSSMLMQQDAVATQDWPAGSADCGGLPGFQIGSAPSSPYDAAGCGGGFRPGAMPSVDSVVSHGSTDVQLAPGLPQFDMPGAGQAGAFDPQAGFRGLGAAGSSLGMPGMHPGALPQVGSSSPHANSSPALSFGGAGNNCSAEGMEHPLNGRSVGQREREREHSRAAQQQQQHGGSLRSSSAAAAAAAAGDGQQQPVFRSQYRGVSYDKKKRKWRVQIKVAALGKSGELGMSHCRRG